MITFKHRGDPDFKKTMNFFKRMKDVTDLKFLDQYGEAGVAALSSATPVKSGLTAQSWRYEIHKEGDSISIEFINDNVKKGYFNVALMLQFGHGTRNGGWVEGRDYINPAIQPIFDSLVQEAWEEVVKK